MMTRLTAWPRTLRAGTRLYRRTPVVLRRPEPWVRLVGVLFVLWFGGMFLALGVLAGVARRPPPPSPWRSTPTSSPPPSGHSG